MKRTEKFEEGQCQERIPRIRGTRGKFVDGRVERRKGEQIFPFGNFMNLRIGFWFQILISTSLGEIIIFFQFPVFIFQFAFYVLQELSEPVKNCSESSPETSREPIRTPGNTGIHQNSSFQTLFLTRVFVRETLHIFEVVVIRFALICFLFCRPQDFRATT